jgi:hypothetical protein
VLKACIGPTKRFPTDRPKFTQGIPTELQADGPQLAITMEDELPPDVRFHKLETRFPRKRVVEHINDGGDSEYWKSDKLPVGSGGQGRVYLQRRISDSRINDLRAVKTIALHDEGRRKRYIRELQILIRVSHPRVRVFESLFNLNPSADLQHRAVFQVLCTITGMVLEGKRVVHRNGVHGERGPRDLPAQ